MEKLKWIGRKSESGIKEVDEEEEEIMLCVVYVQRLLEEKMNRRSEGVRKKDAKREDLEPIRGSTGELGLYVCKKEREGRGSVRGRKRER
jgi:hypothetical protein